MFGQNPVGNQAYDYRLTFTERRFTKNKFWLSSKERLIDG